MAGPPASAPILGGRLFTGWFLQSAIGALLAKDQRGRVATFWQACGASLLHSVVMLGIVLALAFGTYLAFPEQTLEPISSSRSAWRQRTLRSPPMRRSARPCHAQYRREKPDYFHNPAWPLRLAEEAAAAGF